MKKLKLKLVQNGKKIELAVIIDGKQHPVDCEVMAGDIRTEYWRKHVPGMIQDEKVPLHDDTSALIRWRKHR